MRNASEYEEIHFIGVDALIDHLENRWRYSNINDAIRYLTASLNAVISQHIFRHSIYLLMPIGFIFKVLFDYGKDKKLSNEEE